MARPAAAATGFLTANALPWAHVEVDGRRLPRHTPVVRAPLPVGAHTVVLISPTGERHEARVTIEKGAEARVVHRFGR
ncbi:MAG: hypothetical protein H6702_01605 [Myxococcales bacterium]|nr:hypothetical protein [Myxococcales bacterium]